MKLKKVFRSLLVILTCSLSLSCVLEVLPEKETGSVSFSLPKNTIDTRSTDASNGLLNGPENYYVLLMYGSDKTASGKVYEKTLPQGSKVVIEKLSPGAYTLYVRGENNYSIFEKSKPLTVSVGNNPYKIELDKKDKAKVILDLSRLSLPNGSTFDIDVINNNKSLYKKSMIPYNNQKTYLLDYGFLPGSEYTIMFTTSNSANEKYYVNNDENLIIPTESYGTTISCPISSRPTQIFYVNGDALAAGNGDKNSPFNSLGKAIDMIVGSLNGSKDARIIVSGNINENKTIVINNKAVIELIGDNASGANISANVDIDNANITLENININSRLSLYNSNLTIDSNVGLKEIFSTGNSSIIMNSPLTTKTNLSLDEYRDGKKIIESEIPSVNIGDNFVISNPYFDIIADGTIKKAKEKVVLDLNFVPSDRTISAKVYNKNVPSEKYSYSIKDKSTLLNDYFDIGETYVFDIYEEIPGDVGSESKLIGTKCLLIDTDFNKNKVLVSEIIEVYDYFVDSLNGNDLIYNGYSEVRAFASLDKAIEVIEASARLYNAKPYTITVSGNIVSSNVLNIEGINKLTISSSLDSVNLGIASDIKQPFVVSNTELTLNDVVIDSINITNGNLILTGNEENRNLVRVRNIFLGEKSIIKVNKGISNNNMVIDMPLSSYASCVTSKTQIIDVSSLTSSADTLLCFNLKNADYVLKEGIVHEAIVQNTSRTVSLVLDVPITNDRFVCDINNEKYEVVPSSENSNIGNFILDDTSFDSAYQLKLMDKYNYGEVVCQKVVTKGFNDITLNLIRNVYVNPAKGSDDTNDGLSKDTSFKTVTKAIEYLVSKSNGDLDNTYKVYVSAEVSPTSTSEEVPSVVLAELNHTNINSPIKLDIIGVNGNSVDNSGAPIVILPSIHQNGQFVINNKDAEVSISGANVLVDTSITAEKPLVEISNGKFIVNNGAKFKKDTPINAQAEKSDTFMLGSNAKLILRTDSDIGDSTTPIYASLNNGAQIILGENYSNETRQAINVKLNPGYDIATTPIIQSERSGGRINKVEASNFIVDSNYYFDFNNESVPTSDGKLYEYKSVLVNLTNVPNTTGVQTAEQIIASKRYSYRTRLVSDTTDTYIGDITGLNNNSIKVKPNKDYYVDIIDNALSTQDEPIVVIGTTEVNSSNISETHSIALYNFYVKEGSNADNYGTTSTSPCNLINTILRHNFAAEKPSDSNGQGAISAITATINPIIFVDGIISNVSLGNNNPKNVKITIKPIVGGSATIKQTPTDEGFGLGIETIGISGSLRFEDFEINVKAPVTQGRVGLFDVRADSELQLHNISYVYDSSITTEDGKTPICWLEDTQKLKLSGYMNCSSNLRIVIMRQSTGGTCPSIEIPSTITAQTSPIKIEVLELSSGSHDFSNTPQVLVGDGVATSFSLFAPTDPNYVITEAGKIEQNPVPGP